MKKKMDMTVQKVTFSSRSKSNTTFANDETLDHTKRQTTPSETIEYLLI